MKGSFLRISGLFCISVLGGVSASLSTMKSSSCLGSVAHLTNLIACSFLWLYSETDQPHAWTIPWEPPGPAGQGAKANLPSIGESDPPNSAGPSSKNHHVMFSP